MNSDAYSWTNPDFALDLTGSVVSAFDQVYVYDDDKCQPFIIKPNTRLLFVADSMGLGKTHQIENLLDCITPGRTMRYIYTYTIHPFLTNNCISCKTQYTCKHQSPVLTKNCMH